MWLFAYKGCGYLPTKGVVIHLQRVWLFAWRLLSRGASAEDLISKFLLDKFIRSSVEAPLEASL